MSYSSNIGGEPCTQISIQSNGDSTYDGWYEEYVFSTYQFAWIDARGNNIYYANITGTDQYIHKNLDDQWMVSSVILLYGMETA